MEDKKVSVWLVGVVLAFVSGAVSGWIYVDERYVHKTEATAAYASYDKKFSELNQTIQFSIDLNRKAYIEDQLFKLEQIPANKMTDIDRAVFAKFKRDLEALNSRWALSGRPLQ